MPVNKVINVIAFNTELGRLGFDLDKQKSFFQYNPEFLDSGQYTKLFPFVFKRTKSVQVFKRYQGHTFHGLPPMIADSLPDAFGNIIFQKWLDTRRVKKITPLEQLTYVADRGMGALEYQPIKELPKSSQINLQEVTNILEKVLKLKEDTKSENLSELALLNIFKIGTSAGGARPKVLISEHKISGEIIGGDRTISDEYNHYLIKLHLDEGNGYNKEVVEYVYHLLALEAGIEMMPSKLIENKHFATLRYDRQNGQKQHVLTVTGLTGWDFKNQPENSSYENVFKVALGLRVPYKDVQQLFRRMVFNIIFRNVDDHLKNHSFIYNKSTDSWLLGPAYDLTYALNPLIRYKATSRALSINGKRSEIRLRDVLAVAKEFTIKNPKGIIEEIQELIPKWSKTAHKQGVPQKICDKINQDFKTIEL